MQSNSNTNSTEINGGTETAHFLDDVLNDEQHQTGHGVPLSRKDIVNAENSSSFGRICHKCKCTFHSYCMPSHKVGLNPSLSSWTNSGKSNENDVSAGSNDNSEPTVEAPWYCWKCQGGSCFPQFEIYILCFFLRTIPSFSMYQ